MTKKIKFTEDGLVTFILNDPGPNIDKVIAVFCRQSFTAAEARVILQQIPHTFINYPVAFSQELTEARAVIALIPRKAPEPEGCTECAKLKAEVKRLHDMIVVWAVEKQWAAGEWKKEPATAALFEEAKNED